MLNQYFLWSWMLHCRVQKELSSQFRDFFNFHLKRRNFLAWLDWKLQLNTYIKIIATAKKIWVPLQEAKASHMTDGDQRGLLRWLPPLKIFFRFFLRFLKVWGRSCKEEWWRKSSQIKTIKNKLYPRWPSFHPQIEWRLMIRIIVRTVSLLIYHLATIYYPYKIVELLWVLKLLCFYLDKSAIL